MQKEEPDSSGSDSSTVERSSGQGRPQVAMKHRPQSEKHNAKVVCGSKRAAPSYSTSSDEEPLSLAKQPKLTTEPKLQPKGKGKSRDTGDESVPSPPRSPPPHDLDPADLDPTEAAQIQLAIKLSLMKSQHGKAGSSSRMMTIMAPPPSTALPVERLTSISSTDASSQASVPPISEPEDNSSIGTHDLVDPGVSRHFPPKVLHRLRAECRRDPDDLDHFEEMLKVKGDLPSAFMQAWSPLKSLWESCGIYFDSRDPDVQASSFAAWGDLRKLLTPSNALGSPATRKFHKFFQALFIFSWVNNAFSCNGY